MTITVVPRMSVEKFEMAMKYLHDVPDFAEVELYGFNFSAVLKQAEKEGVELGTLQGAAFPLRNPSKRLISEIYRKEREMDLLIKSLAGVRSPKSLGKRRIIFSKANWYLMEEGSCGIDTSVELTPYKVDINCKSYRRPHYYDKMVKELSENGVPLSIRLNYNSS